MITNTKQLGEAIRFTRKQLGITQQDLALSAGTGLRFIVDLEQGKNTVQFGKALDVIQALGLSIELVATVPREHARDL
jgi:HTH-type transcriptional regulator / antitoxin HipB